MHLRFVAIPIMLLMAGSLAVFRSPMHMGIMSLLAILAACVVALKQTRTNEMETVRSRVLIVGSGTLAKELATNLERSGNYQVVGFVDDMGEASASGTSNAAPILGFRTDTASLVKQYSIDRVFITAPPSWQQQLVEQLADDSSDVAISIVPNYYESMMRTGAIDHLGDIALVRLQTEPGRFAEGIKRVLDIVASSLGLIVLAPLMIVVSVLIKLTSRGPVIFKQERIGRYGVPFSILKFRTMRNDAEEATGPILASGDSDARLTFIGRWLRAYRIDEVPQLWNVLCNEMSVVGPRPERTCFVKLFENTIPTYCRRHQVRPGITGLAQVCGGYHTDARDKLRFDLIYVAHQSVWYDFMILFRTIRVVLLQKSRGAQVFAVEEPISSAEAHSSSI